MKQVRVLAGHLCFERDLFLRVLECERDRDLERDTRRPLLDRLEERFFMSAGGRAAASSSERHFITKTWIACSTSKCLTWLYSSSDGGLGFPHPLHHTFQLLSSGLWRHLWGFYYGVVGMINSERHKR